MSDELAPISAMQMAAAEAAHAVETRIKENVKKQKELWIELARDLYQFEAARLWAELGYTSFGAWLADPDIDIDPRWGYLLTQMWREFVHKRGVEVSMLKTIEPSKLQEVLPAVRRGHPIEDALADVQSLSKTDLRERYSGSASRPTSNGSMPDTGTGLEATYEKQVRMCSSCGYPIPR